jgi:hypothetical protein
MRRPRRGSFEDGVARGHIAPWEWIQSGILYEKTADPARNVEPFPPAFCVLFIVLGSLLIYGGVYSLLLLLFN